jgi:hypothetical protein
VNPIEILAAFLLITGSTLVLGTVVAADWAAFGNREKRAEAETPERKAA